MAKSQQPSNGLRNIHPSTVKMAQADAQNVMSALADATAPRGAAVTASVPATAAPAGAVPGDTPAGINVDYQGPQPDDMPVGALTDSQVVALVRNILLRQGAPFFFRFQNQIYIRTATLS